MKQIYSGDKLDRASKLRFNKRSLNLKKQSSQTYYILTWRGKNLVSLNDSTKALFLSNIDNLSEHESDDVIFLGLINKKIFLSVDFSKSDQPPKIENGVFADLRNLGQLLSKEDASLLAYAKAMSHWNESTIYCPKCGNLNKISHAGHQKICLNFKML